MRDTLNIRDHMPVIAADGLQIGIVEHLDKDDRIKLTKNSADDGKHHFIPTAWVDHIDQHVHLNVTSDDARRRWQ